MRKAWKPLAAVLLAAAFTFLCALYFASARYVKSSTIDTPQTRQAVERFTALAGEEAVEACSIVFVEEIAEDPTLWGGYYPADGLILLKVETVEHMTASLCHEYGHHVALSRGWRYSDAFNAAFYGPQQSFRFGGCDWTEYAYSNIDEFCAMTVALYLEAPQQMEETFPELYTIMITEVKEHD